MKSFHGLGWFVLFCVSCAEVPAEVESTSDSGDIAVSRSELMGTLSMECSLGGFPMACDSNAAAQLDNSTTIVRTVVRSTAFLQCMDTAMRVGIPMNNNLPVGDIARIEHMHTQAHANTDVNACFGAPAGTYRFDSLGPYVSCRPQHEPNWGGIPDAGWINHDGAWNELIDRQIARVFTALQQDIDTRLSFRADVDSNGDPIERGGGQQGGLGDAGLQALILGWSLPALAYNLGDRIGWPGNDGGPIPTFIHEYLHDLGYDHGCAFTDLSDDHGNCGRRPGLGNWNPNSTMNNIAAICLKEVALRSAETNNNGCGVQTTMTHLSAPYQDLRHCDGDNGRMLVSRFMPQKDIYTDCQCVPDIVAFRESANDTRLGSSFARGDFDKDGWMDLAVGAPGIATGHANTGVFIYRGGSQGLRPWQYMSPAELGATTNGSLCGTALTAGDFNDDLVTDLAVSCPGSGFGKVIVLSGCGTGCVPASRGLQLPAMKTITGISTARAFGMALATARFDVAPALPARNRDDLIIGAPNSLVGGVASGHVEIYLGSGANLVQHPTITSFVPPTPQANQKFGAALAAGNLTGTVEGDILVGAPSTGSSTGSVFVIKGPTGTVSSVSVTGVLTSARLGTSVAVAEVRGDTYDDAIVGAPGMVALFSAAGASANVGSLSVAVTGTAASGFGTSVAPHSADTVIVGAHGGTGATSLVRFNDPSPAAIVGAVNPTLWSARHESYSFNGNSFTGNCPRYNDINKDHPCPIDATTTVSGSSMGTAVIAGSFGQGLQIVSGAPTYPSSGFTNAGAVFVHAGATTGQEYRFDRSNFTYGGSPLPIRRFGATQSWSSSLCLASETCVLADVDNDGDDDVVIFTGTQVRVALSNGTSFAAPAVAHTNFPCGTADQCRAEDVNADGRADFVSFSKSPTGDVHVSFTVFNAGNYVYSARTKVHDWFCVSQEYCALGDVNGDGRHDLIAFDRSNGNVWVSLAPSSGTQFGPGTACHDNMCVGTQQCRVGDVNGDGFDDLIAFSANTAGPIVWVTFSIGGDFEDWVQVWNYNFGNTGDDFDVRDINNDGFDDAVLFRRSSSTTIAALSNGRDFGPAQTWKTSLCGTGHVCLLGDVTDDGRADLVTFTHGATSTASAAISGQ